MLKDKIKKLFEDYEHLPKIVKIPQAVITDLANGNETAVADYLSDEYGFLVSTVNVKKKDGKFYATNIDWDIDEDYDEETVDWTKPQV